EGALHLTHNLPYLLSALLALLAVPALVWRPDAGPGLSWSPWAEGALALGALAVTTLYTLAAERRVRGRLGRRGGATGAGRVPALLAVTGGISLSQARAVLEGLAGRRSEFVRTPKRGAGSIRSAPFYRSPRGRGPVLELACAAALSAGLVQALASGRLLAAP